MDLRDDIKVEKDEEKKENKGPVDSGSIDLDTFLAELHGDNKERDDEEER